MSLPGLGKSSRRKWLRFFAVGLTASLAVAQLWQPAGLATPVQPTYSLLESPKAPAAIRQMLQSACADCHSSRVQWPWYGSISPVSWWLAGHVREARLAINFDELLKEVPESVSDRLGESCDEMRAAQMPPREYRWMHSGARLSPAQVDQFCRWAASFDSGK